MRVALSSSGRSPVGYSLAFSLPLAACFVLFFLMLGVVGAQHAQIAALKKRVDSLEARPLGPASS